MYSTILAIAVISLFGSSRSAYIGCFDYHANYSSTVQHYFQWFPESKWGCFSAVLPNDCQSVPSEPYTDLTFSPDPYLPSFLQADCSLIQLSTWIQNNLTLNYTRHDGYTNSCTLNYIPTSTVDTYVNVGAACEA